MFANQSQLRAAYEVLSLAAVQKQIMSDDLVRECKELRKKLKDNRGHKFPPARPRIVPASMGSSSSSADAGTGSGSAQIAAAEKSSPLGDCHRKKKEADIIGDCHRKNTVKDNNGSAYPECNKTGTWKSGTRTRKMKNQRASEIRKLQREFAKRVASASGQRKKKSKKLK